MHVFAKSFVLSSTLAIPKSPSLIYANLIKKWPYLPVFQKNVLRLHIPVQYFTFMQVKQCQRHLSQPVYYLALRKVLALACFNSRIDITTITIDHDNVEVLLPVNIWVFVCYNIWMSNLLQQPDFILSVLQILLAHVPSLHPLDNIVFPFTLVSCQINLTEWTATDCFYDFIHIHFL